MTDTDRSVLVLIPTYNERESLSSAVAGVRAAVPDAHILIVDDASPDGSGQLADELAAADPAVHVLHRSSKQGLGAAYLAGFRWGMGRGYDVLVEMDADGSHRPEHLPMILAALTDADAVIGSRWVPGGAVENWPRSRRLLSRGGNTYARIMLDLPVRDVTAGYRAYRRSALERIDLRTVQSEGYCFQVDLTRRIVRAGMRVREVPITFVERTAGESKMSRTIVAEALWRVTAWGIHDRWRRVARREGEQWA
jgi:dolichol-phosphate mannosyltransferase